MLLLLGVYIPLCYNEATNTLVNRSKFELRGVECINYVIVLCCAGFFISLLWDQCTQA